MQAMMDATKERQRHAQIGCIVLITITAIFALVVYGAIYWRPWYQDAAYAAYYDVRTFNVQGRDLLCVDLSGNGGLSCNWEARNRGD